MSVVLKVIEVGAVFGVVALMLRLAFHDFWDDDSDLD